MSQGEPLDILMVGSIFGVGGIARHVIELRTWLEERGHRVTLAGTGDVWANSGTSPGFVELPIQTVTGEGGHLFARLFAAMRAAYRLRRWLERHPVDVIHCHESAPALVAVVARIGLNIPIMVTYHGSEPERVRSFGTIARRTDLVVTPSYASARDLETVGAIDPDRLKVIGLGVKKPPEASTERVRELRRQLLNDGDRLIVTVARLSYQKGIDILIDCVRELHARQPVLRFVVVGTGPEEARLHALAKDKGLESSVLNFAGHSEEPHLYLRAADLFLLTSRWEALPYTIVESFQVGTPAIATACSGVVELIDDTVGAVVPVGDTEAICEAVEDLIRDPERLVTLADAAIARSREDRFDPEWVNGKFEALYRNVASKKRRS